MASLSNTLPVHVIQELSSTEAVEHNIEGLTLAASSTTLLTSASRLLCLTDKELNGFHPYVADALRDAALALGPAWTPARVTVALLSTAQFELRGEDHDPLVDLLTLWLRVTARGHEPARAEITPAVALRWLRAGGDAVVQDRILEQFAASAARRSGTGRSDLLGWTTRFFERFADVVEEYFLDEDLAWVACDLDGNPAIVLAGLYWGYLSTPTVAMALLPAPLARFLAARDAVREMVPHTTKRKHLKVL